MRKSLRFNVDIEACGLMHIGFSGKKVTWSNKRGISQRIWRRLDRGLINDNLLDIKPQTSITHLSSTCSGY